MNDVVNNSLKSTKATTVVSLFSSAGTLICCTLPALLVALGAGATLSSLITAIPQLVWFSEHKVVVFFAAAVMLVLSGAMQWRARTLPCPVDVNLAAACTRTRAISWRIYVMSIILFCVGGFFAFIAPLLNA